MFTVSLLWNTLSNEKTQIEVDLGVAQLAKIAVESGNLSNFCKTSEKFHQLCNGEDARSREFWTEVLDLTWGGIENAKNAAPEQLIYPDIQHKKLYDLYLTIGKVPSNKIARAVRDRFLGLFDEKEYDRAFEMAEDGIMDKYMKKKYMDAKFRRDNVYQSALRTFIDNYDPNRKIVLKKLIHLGASPVYAFQSFSRLGIVEALRYLVDEVGLTKKQARKDGNHALYIASEYGHVDVLKYLLEGLGLTVSRYNYNQVFLTASIKGHVDVMKYLFEKVGRTKKDARSTNISALRFASRTGNVAVLKFLVEEAGLTAEDARHNNNESFRLASEYGSLNFLKYMVEKLGFNAEDVLSNDRQAIKVASEKGNDEVVLYLESLLQA